MRSDDFRIRKASQEDIETIAELWKELMDFHKERDQHFIRSANGHERFAEFVSGRIAHEGSCVLVAEQQDEIVAYCLASISKYPPVYKHREYGAIFDLAVTENCRRQGIGQALLDATLQWFSEQEISRVEVRVATANELSTAFWRGMGFVPYLEIVYKEI